MPSDEKPAESPPEKEKKSGSLFKWLWFTLACVVVAFALTIAVAANFVKLSQIIIIIVIIGIVVGAVVFFAWFLFKRRSKSVALPKLTKLEVRNILLRNVQRPVEKGGLLVELDPTRATIDTVRTLGSDKKIDVYQIRAVKVNSQHVHDAWIRIDDPDKWGVTCIEAGEDFDEYKERVNELVNDCAETRADYVKTIYKGPDGTVTREETAPVPRVQEPEHDEAEPAGGA